MTTLEKIRAEIDNECKKYDRVGAICCGLNVAIAVIDKYAEQEPCDDAISRQAVLDGIDTYINKAQSTGTQDDFYSFAELVVKQLPSVRPQEQTGHWIRCDILQEFKCSECRECFRHKTYYCPNCGAKMVELQERSDKE